MQWGGGLIASAPLFLVGASNGGCVDVETRKNNVKQHDCH